MALPSATFPVSELRKITAIQHYEERMLFTALFLRDPALRLVYLTSLPVDEAIVEYYLRFLPDPEGARARLHMVGLGEDGPLPLTEKLLRRPDVVDQVRHLVGDPAGGHILPFNVTPMEQRLADSLGLPLFGPTPRLAQLGSKSGGRRVARSAGIAVPPGQEGLYSLEELEEAVLDLRSGEERPEAVVIKLNDGFSGQGNVIIDLNSVLRPLTDSRATFCGEGESWPAYLSKVSVGGAVVEQVMRWEDQASPSVQLRIGPAGTPEVLSTHDQILGGPDNHVYLGCRFPAPESYRLAIQEAGIKVGEVLAAEGVVGTFGIDFLVAPRQRSTPIYMSEINLRMGGTTHPFWMTRLATGGTYDHSTGTLVAGGQAKCYVATDNLKSASLVGLTPARVIEGVDKSGLGYEPTSATGTTLHLMGAVTRYGKMGVTCVASSLPEAEELYREVVDLLGQLGRPGRPGR